VEDTVRTARRLVAALVALGITATGCRDRSAGAPAGDSLSIAPPSVRYDQNVAAGGVAPPEGHLTNPYRGDARSAAEGALLFRTMNCDGCHGGAADGWVGPSLIDGRWRYGGTDAVVFQSVFYGRPEGMPAFGGILAPDLTWKIVTWLQSQPVPKAVPTQSW
jgi:cytochrome c oxidase cbb3-type subunit III